ncbi:MAG TPA: SAM-dependent methyltransferase [Pseudonocardiaceae bacterium]|nr:SAM-dependent methyltransferase [Pseudonocardiaceae bacterium]
MSQFEDAPLPPTIDPTQPSAARAYDYYLGGSSNFAADREFADQVKLIAPFTVPLMALNRSFLRRSVQFLLNQGVRQFLDLGSGIPTVGNTHQVAGRLGISARTVYVDNEPVAYHHAQTMLADRTDTTILHADMRDVTGVLTHPDTQRLLDFTEPVGLLIVGVLLYFPDHAAVSEMIAAYRRHLTGGGYLAISTLTDEPAPPPLRADLAAMLSLYRGLGEPLYPRTRAEVTAWFDGTDLVEPGVVEMPLWRNDTPAELDEPARTLGYAGVSHFQ